MLLWSIVRANIPSSIITEWPWRLQLLDIGSATTMTTVTAGLVLARAQFATAVRPIPLYTGRVVRIDHFSSRYAWVVRLENGSTSPARFHRLEYQVSLRHSFAEKFRDSSDHWVNREEAIGLLEAATLRNQTDFDLQFFADFSLSNSSQPVMIGVFTTKAMEIIDDIKIRMTITAQSGDSRSWVINCMTGAIRNPKRISID